MWPGPTIVVPKGTETVIRFLNNATLANAVHLHGGHSRSPWDGWSEDLIQPGEFKDYYYPNYQTARTIWYHDHGMHLVCFPISLTLPGYQSSVTNKRLVDCRKRIQRPGWCLRYHRR